MKRFTKKRSHLVSAGQSFILATALVSLTACSTTSTSSKPSSASTETEEQLLFVQSAEDLKVDTTKKTLRLVEVNPQTLYFSDRPFRVAGHITMDDYLKEWTDAAGKDNFTVNPPNATLSVYEPGRTDNTIVVVEIFKPVVDGRDIVYGYKVIDGTLPAMGGATALFIDRIGPGGGVGVGHRGVGVGRRGPGVR